MNSNVAVYKQIKEDRQKALSNKSRIIVFLLAFFIPIGSHEFYLGRLTRGFTYIGYLLLFWVPIFMVFMQLGYALYITFIISEGFRYLFCIDVQDADGYSLKPVGFMENRSYRYFTAVILAFALPIGIHRYVLKASPKRSILTIIFSFVFALYYIGIALHHVMPMMPTVFVMPMILMPLILISWIDGIRLLLANKRKVSVV